MVLAVLDRKWREHLYEMDYLKDGIGLRGMGQRDPLVEYQREGYQMYNSMIEAIKEESIQLLFNVDIDQIAKTEDLNSESDEDAAVDQARESLGEGGATEGDDAAETLTFNAPEDPDGSDEDADEQSAASELAEPKDDASADEEAQEGSVVGPKPLSHAEQKVPANKRPKEEELRTPWSDGRTFPGTSRHAPCPCGSGRKYKMCHGQNE